MLYSVLKSMGFDHNSFDLQDDGKGPYIVRWHSSEKQPTLQEIEAAWPAVQRALAAVSTIRYDISTGRLVKIINNFVCISL